MKLLAFDTCTDACTVGLLVDSEYRIRHHVEARAHTRLLVPMIEELMAEGGLAPQELDAIVIGNGPGSFIGVRIGVSVAQGLAHAAGLPVIPVSSLEAIAAAVFADNPVNRVAVAQDARMEQVYLACFDRGKNDLPVADGSPELHAVGDPVRVCAPFVLAGGASGRYPGLTGGHEEYGSELDGYAHPHARWLLALGARDFSAGRTQDADTIEPAYVRSTVASPPKPA